MKSIIASIACSGLLATLAMAQPLRYTVKDLGPVGPAGQPFFIANNGLVSGAAAVSGGADHAVFWYQGSGPTDLGTLGGPNSLAFGVNDRGQFVGHAETSVPNGEDFCGFQALGLPSSGTACLPFLWQNGAMTPLPTLGGNNGLANSINVRGQVAGLAETNTPDPKPNCPVNQFKPVIWQNGETRELQTYPGDTDGVAAQINDSGQVAGSSGTCATFNPNSGLYLVENHALLWQNGTVTDLGNLGGTGGIAGNHACAINNQGHVVGHSELTNDSTFHGFLWTRETGMQDLGTLDFASLALGINDSGVVVGASLTEDFNVRAVRWENGVPLDLNTLILGESGLYLLSANSINSSEEIVGLAFDTVTNDLHGFLATPSHRPAASENFSPASQRVTSPMVLSEDTRKLLQQRLRLGRFGARLPGPR